MARTAPVPNIPAIPGMNPGVIEAVPPALLSWIRGHARWGTAWDEASLRRFLEERGAPCPEILVDWERTLHALSDGRPMESHYILEVSDTCFGTVATGAGVATIPGDGRTVVILGRFVWGGALGMDASGQLFSSDGDSWTAVAQNPWIYLTRLVLQSLAREEGRMHLVLTERAHAALLAERLGAAEVAHASDAIQRFWELGTILLYEGGVGNPSSSAGHALAGASDVSRLLQACSALHLSGALEDSSSTPQIAALVRQTGGCPHPVWMPYRPRHGRGEGWVALRHEKDLPVVEQVCVVDGFRVSEREWPSGYGIEHVEPWVEGLSEPGQALLLRLGFRRDLRRTCHAEELEVLLAHHGLPSSPAVEELERRLGGLRCPLRDGAAWLSFGAYQMLAFEEENRDHASWASDSAAIEDGAAWPRVRLRGAALVPVGSDVEATFYMSPTGELLRHDWILDEVDDLGADPLGYLERRLVWMDARW